MNRIDAIKDDLKFHNTTTESNVLYLISIIQQAEKALEKITQQEIVKTNESSGLMAMATIKINSHRIIAEEALKAIRGN